MASLLRRPRSVIVAFLGLVIYSMAGLGTMSAFARLPDNRSLQLEVFINGEKTRLIGSFSQLADGRLAASRGELEEIGVKAPGSGSAEELIILETITSITYRYDERTQTITITLSNSQRVTRQYDATPVPNAPPATPSDYGSVLNYTLFAVNSYGFDKSKFVFSGASAFLDARFFSPYGVLSQSAILGTTTMREVDALRLDTTYTYSNPSTLMTYRAGDAISGGLSWTRSIRFGGLQVQRNFALRSDLITSPLPAVSGTALVPSTLDVYLNNVKTFSQEVPGGPYSVTNLPVLSGGNARVVLRDSTGREVETTMPFYSTPILLRSGLWDFSAEAGYPRLGYGTASDDYIRDAFSSFSVRHGLLDTLTLEAHGEIGNGLYNGGVGLAALTGSFGVVSLAASASQFAGDTGLQLFAAYETKIFGMFFNFSSQRTLGRYDDLASVTGRNIPVMNLSPLPLGISLRPPKALDRATVSMPLPFDRSSISLSFINLEPDLGARSQIVSASWSRSFAANSQLFVTAYADFADRRSLGVYAGLSIPFGQRETASLGVVASREGTSVVADAVRPLSQEIGSYGWRIRDSEGETPYRAASASYRAAAGRIQTGIEQFGRSVRGTAEFEGAIAMMGGGVFFSNRIDDSFAVVDVGAPGVEVFYENRPIGVTNPQGMFLVPSLRAYQANKISFDPRSLPVNADIPQIKDVVAPADRAGVIVRFGVKTDVSSAVVILTDAKGKALPVGLKGRLNGGEESLVVGYDGRVFVKGLMPENSLLVATDAGECRASFAFAPAGDSQIVIGPVRCQ